LKPGVPNGKTKQNNKSLDNVNFNERWGWDLVFRKGHHRLPFIRA